MTLRHISFSKAQLNSIPSQLMVLTGATVCAVSSLMESGISPGFLGLEFTQSSLLLQILNYQGT